MNQPQMSLSEMLGLVKQAVSMMFEDGLWLTAEVLNYSIRGGHHYLELVEYDEARRERAKATGTVWKSNTSVLTKFQKATGNPISAGMKILLKAVPTFHEVYGLSLKIVDINATFTLGDMESRLNEIRQHLQEKGWWDMNRNLETPQEFCRLAVISPADAAGLGDFRVDADKLEAAGLCSFQYFPAAFQGLEASNQIVDQMVRILDIHKQEPFEACVMIRGGGDKAGLYQLNHRRLATAVCRFPIPIMVGIGHERDSVILDEVANSRFPTPSLLIAHIRHTIIQNAQNALADWNRISRLANLALTNAEHACEQQSRLLKSEATRQLDQGDSLLDKCITQNRHTATNTIERAEKQLSKSEQEFLRSAGALCDQADELLESGKAKIFKQAEVCIQTAQREIEHQVSSVMSANPIAILGRGYAYVKQGNKFVRSVDDVAAGDSLQINLKEGSIMATVEGVANVQ